ncbi:hypothetical protein [Granulicella arctica]|uniref:hypothetical protein n=1 Tax=Granulicella arctica TaxID=940613 RepID=UPI0021E005ED|nr:hypothetical protein [Granulicella arctica]
MIRFARRVSVQANMHRLALLAFVFVPFSSATSQTPSAQPPASVEQRLNDVTAALNQTQQTLERSMQEIQALRAQLEALRAQLPTAAAAPVIAPPLAASTAPQPTADTIERIREEQDATQSEIKLHEQTKIESASKYPLRVTGLILFNAFSNAGVVNNVDLPGVALSRPADGPHGSTGGSLRQTILGVEGTGPRILGARSSAEVSADLFGGLTYNEYGYSTSVGNIIRLRQGKISLDWDKTTIDAGVVNPIISPLSPTSFATVAEPALSSAGNLWTWSPQIRIEQRVPLSGQRTLHLEAALLDPASPPAVGSTVQGSSPTEASRHPSVEGRISYGGSTNYGESAGGSDASHHLVFGLAAYTGDQLYGTTHVHSWAATADWQLPVYRWFTLSGEAYRGRALGGLGGGVYKDILTGTSHTTGLPLTTGVDAVGGWAQWKTRFSSTLEANAVFGLDDALASNFRRIILPSSTSPYSLYARNSMVVGNVIYRPRTYLILSPEYRRITTWPGAGTGNIANIFTISAGYQF